jgi:hypothetical protein
MAANLPYVPSPGSIKSALDKIRNAAVPSRVTGDFVETILQIKGGTGRAIPPFLKRIGFVGSDGVPTDLYKRFRNAALGGKAMAAAIIYGYAELAQANEYFYRLGDKDLLALIVQVTGVDAESRAAVLTLSSIKQLKAYADFDADDNVELPKERVEPDENLPLRPPVLNGMQTATPASQLGLNLSYTINLNLPATSDQAVFNAIFRSLKEHLLSTNE